MILSYLIHKSDPSDDLVNTGHRLDDDLLIFTDPILLSEAFHHINITNCSFRVNNDPVCQTFCQYGHGMVAHTGCIHPVTGTGVSAALHMAKHRNSWDHAKVFPEKK